MFLILKIVGVIGVLVFIIGIFKLINGFGDFETNDFLVGSFMMPIGAFIGFSGLMFGFKPEISKMTIKSVKYIQEENKDTLKEMTQTSTEIYSEAVTTITKAINKGLRETMYCKYCGNEIEVDSKFCKHCGEKLE